MKCTTLNLAVLTVFSLTSQLSLATGFVNIPTTGFAVTGGTSAYTLCNTTGNFGSGSGLKPTPTANNICAVFPPNEATSPEAGFSIVASASRSVLMNNIYTGNADKTVGTVTEYVWRKQTGSNYECIYGAKVSNSNTDYNTSAAGNQYFQVSDFARGGFSGLPLDVAYSTIPTAAYPVYRVGRAYTAVQYGSSGYSSQPLTGLGSSPSINGLNSYPGIASSTQQLADIDGNWVDFTTSLRGGVSSMFYVKTSCSADNPLISVNDEAIRLRQTTAPFIEIKVRGFVPPGGSITPTHTDPF